MNLRSFSKIMLFFLVLALLFITIGMIWGLHTFAAMEKLATSHESHEALVCSVRVCALYAMLCSGMLASQKALVERQNKRFISMTAKLDALSPMKVLTRGYSIVSKDDGDVLRSVRDVAAGQCLNIAVSDGSITATVADVKENSHE